LVISKFNKYPTPQNKALKYKYSSINILYRTQFIRKNTLFFRKFHQTQYSYILKNSIKNIRKFFRPSAWKLLYRISYSLNHIKLKLIRFYELIKVGSKEDWEIFLLKIFSYIRKVFSDSPSIFTKKKRVLLVRTDNIGDYILFRNFLKILRGSKEFKNKKIILIGNETWRTLAETFDKDVVNSFIWINKKQYQLNIQYKLTILLKIRALHAHQIINTVHSRDTLIDDIIIFSGAHARITCEGDDVNNRLSRNTFKKFTKIVPSLPNTHFEFYRNKAFFENLLELKVDIQKTSFDLVKKKRSKNQISIFPSAAYPQRRWNPLYFAQVITLFSQDNPDFHFSILGSQDDTEIAMTIINNVPKTLIIDNLCGKTNLVELVNILSKTGILISNETSAVHFAAALDVPTVCISNGERFQRFSPYPLSISDKIVTLFPNDFFYDKSKFLELALQYQYESPLDINSIQPQSVFEKVTLLLKL
jgi:ADP-heptose:LPS heptosyltransferase